MLKQKSDVPVLFEQWQETNFSITNGALLIKKRFKICGGAIVLAIPAETIMYGVLGDHYVHCTSNTAILRCQQDKRTPSTICD